MRFTCVESFPPASAADTETRLRQIRQIIDDRLADEIARRIRAQQHRQELP